MDGAVCWPATRYPSFPFFRIKTPTTC